MLLVFLVLTAFAVFAVAAVAVGRVVGQTRTLPREAVFDLDEAVEWVADRLPEQVQARLTYDEVHQILAWYLDELESKGVAFESDEDRPDPDGSGALVVDDDQVLARILARATAAGLSVSDEDVVLVIEEQDRYLDAIGAVGPSVLGPVDDE